MSRIQDESVNGEIGNDKFWGFYTTKESGFLTKHCGIYPGINEESLKDIEQGSHGIN